MAAGGSLSDLVGAPVPEPSICARLLTVGLILLPPWLRKRNARVGSAGSQLCALVCACIAIMMTTPVAQAGLFDDVPALSPDGQSKLLVHFNGCVGVTTGGGGEVTGWNGLDGDGNTVFPAAIAGAGATTNITYNGAGVVFNETNTADTLHLAAPLTHSENGNWTIFWFGHYDSSNQNTAEGSGLYTYNLTDLAGQASGFNQQRDDGDGGFQGEIWTGGDGDDGASTSALTVMVALTAATLACSLLLGASVVYAEGVTSASPRRAAWHGRSGVGAGAARRLAEDLHAGCGDVTPTA